MTKMKILIFCLFLGLACSQASALSTDQRTLINAATSNVSTNNSTTIVGNTTAVIQVCCTFSAQVNFLASVDGTNYDPIGCVPIATNSSYVTNATSRGLYRCNIIGINTSLKTDIINYVSGTITVTVGLTSAGVS